MDVQELLDREAIRRTLARYTLSGDRGKLEALVGCFAPDGVLEFEHEWTARGHAEIRERVAGARDLTVGTGAAVLLRHQLSTQDVELVSPDEARALTYFTAVTSVGPDHVGRYVDRLVRTGEGWRISHRVVRVEWWSPDTIYPAQAARARDRAPHARG